MRRHTCLAVLCFLTLVTVSHAGPVGGTQAANTANAAATAAVNASPDLTAALSKELNATPEQSAGAAGALFGVAKTRLKPAEFLQVSNAVPGMAQLLNAAPAMGGAGKSNPLAQVGGLAAAASAFSKLGLSPSLVAKAVPVLTSFVSKSGGADVGKLLAGALK
jgi:hypothetical protein